MSDLTKLVNCKDERCNKSSQYLSPVKDEAFGV